MNITKNQIDDLNATIMIELGKDFPYIFFTIPIGVFPGRKPFTTTFF